MGIFPDILSGSQPFVHVERIFEPDPANVARYDALYDLFKAFHDALQPVFDRLAQLP